MYFNYWILKDLKILKGNRIWIRERDDMFTCSEGGGGLRCTKADKAKREYRLRERICFFVGSPLYKLFWFLYLSNQLVWDKRLMDDDYVNSMT